MTGPEAHRATVEAWRGQRYAALRREIGWLTLVGLDWLRSGANRLGSADSNDIILPAGPPRAGTLTLDGGRVTVEGAFRHHGEPIDQLPLESDANGEPTMLELGSLRLCLIDRGGRLAVRTWDTEAPQRHRFEGIDHWPVDAAWRLDARFEATPGRTVRVPDVIGIDEEEETPGDVAFEVGGTTYRLQALPGGEAGELWLVFGDMTNGAETYGGGRFLYTDAPDADGRVVIDFNRAYNPPCVFSPFATCPLPWQENRLPIRVEAGERAYHPSSGR